LNISNKIAAEIRKRAKADIPAKEVVFVKTLNKSARKRKYQDFVADEVAKDVAVLSRKTENPEDFNTVAGALCVWGGYKWIEESGMKEKLKTAASIKFIYSYGVMIQEDDIEDFELVETIELEDGKGKMRGKETLRIFKRVKVYV
jgi:hypothetical protein